MTGAAVEIGDGWWCMQVSLEYMYVNTEYISSIDEHDINQ